MRDGKVIRAIGCTGGTSPQDGQACKAGADTIKHAPDGTNIGAAVHRGPFSLGQSRP